MDQHWDMGWHLLRLSSGRPPLRTQRTVCRTVLGEMTCTAAMAATSAKFRNQNRLITNRSKSNQRGSPAPNARGGSYARYANYAGYAMIAGYEDFPSPESF